MPCAFPNDCGPVVRAVLACLAASEERSGGEHFEAAVGKVFPGGQTMAELDAAGHWTLLEAISKLVLDGGAGGHHPKYWDLNPMVSGLDAHIKQVFLRLATLFNDYGMPAALLHKIRRSYWNSEKLALLCEGENLIPPVAHRELQDRFEAEAFILAASSPNHKKIVWRDSTTGKMREIEPGFTLRRSLTSRTPKT